MITLHENFLSRYDCEQYEMVSVVDVDMKVNDEELMDKLHRMAIGYNPEILKPEYANLSTGSGLTSEGLHFDGDMKIGEDGNLYISPLIGLIYLNDCDGPVWFPFQRKYVYPQTGLLLLFPTTFMYSHKIMPHKLPRPVLNTSFFIKTDVTGKDAEDLLKQHSGTSYYKLD